MKKSNWTGSLTILAAVGMSAAAQQAPSCSQWQARKLATRSCLCGAEVRVGQDRAKACDEGVPQSAGAEASRKSMDAGAVSQRMGEAMAMTQELSFDNSSASRALPDAPQPQKPRKDRKFGLKSVTVDGGYIAGADGSGAVNGSVAVEFYRQKTKAGTLSAEVEAGRYRMGGIPIDDTENLGVIGQLPDGTPVKGAAVTTGRSPAVSYLPLADFKYQPPVRFGRVHPYAVAELGMSRLSSTNAKVDTKIISTVDGQVVDVQDMGPSLQPTGEGINHLGGGFGGGAKVDLTRSGKVAFDAQYIDAPTGYKVVKYGLTYQLGKKKAKRE